MSGSRENRRNKLSTSVINTSVLPQATVAKINDDLRGQGAAERWDISLEIPYITNQQSSRSCIECGIRKTDLI
jgi:hypothetical protein